MQTKVSIVIISDILCMTIDSSTTEASQHTEHVLRRRDRRRRRGHLSEGGCGGGRREHVRRVRADDGGGGGAAAATNPTLSFRNKDAKKVNTVSTLIKSYSTRLRELAQMHATLQTNFTRTPCRRRGDDDMLEYISVVWLLTQNLGLTNVKM